jgi:riboflavin kinase/FMN adenylyltransferase
MSATEFVRNILVNQLNVRLMTIGYNHHFGKNREGDINLLKELGQVYNFEVEEIPAFRLDELSVSSTKIRNAIKTGDIKTANIFLGETFSFSGTVSRGDRIGTKLGYPTANITKKENTQISPGEGVYAVKVKINGALFSGMMNIGFRPTVSVDSERRIEVHIFDFDEDIYGKEVEVIVLDRVREERSFDSMEALKKQISKDEEVCKRIISGSDIRI